MPPPSPVMPSASSLVTAAAESQYLIMQQASAISCSTNPNSAAGTTAAAAAAAALQLRSQLMTNAQQQQVGAAGMSMQQPFSFSSSSDRKTNVTIDRSPNPRFAQDYPVFTPVKSYEEFYVGSESLPPDSSSKSEDSLEALRDDEDWLSPLALDDSCHTHALDLSLHHTLHMPGQRATSASTARLAALQANRTPTTAASAVLIHSKKVESRPYHITSIHPHKTQIVAHKHKPRIRSAEFSRPNQQPQLANPNSNSTFRKKPLSELLNEINAAKLKSKTKNASSGMVNPHPKDSDSRCIPNPQVNHPNEPTPSLSHSNPNSSSRGGSSDNGCIQSCDKCLPGSRMTIVPLMDSADYGEIPANDGNFVEPTVPAKSKGANRHLISWFRSIKKAGSQTPVMKGSKNQPSNTNNGAAAPTQTLNSVMMDKERENIGAVKKKLCMNLEEGKDTLEMAVNTMKQEVSQANEKRDAALVEVFELKMAVEDMAKKLENLESYCQTLKHDITDHNQMNNVMISTVPLDHDGYGDETEDDDNDKMLPSSLSSTNGTQFTGPSKKEFYHAVTEARVGVKQFCRTLLQQIQEQSATTDKIEGILQPYNVKVAPKLSKSVRYHLEAVINEAFYEDFENIKFQKSGTNCVLDPRQRPQAFYQTYVGMSRMGWSELVSRESAAYSQSFDAFCDHKMNRVEQVLNWEGRWPDDLARSFFVAAKWVWLLHLLAFSFHHPALIFRVGSEELFNSKFMEELVVEQTTSSTKTSSKVNTTNYGVDPTSPFNIKTMVMPGFFFNNYEIIKCKVILSRQPLTPITNSQVG